MNVELLKHQWEFLACESKYAALIGGIGSGKTFTLAHYLINRVKQYPRALHFVGANTYSQLLNSTLSSIFLVLQSMGIEFKYNKSTSILSFLGGRVLCKSMENFNVLRGIEVATFILDEARDMDKMAFDTMMGRLRDPKCDKLQGRIVTSPLGFNWIYDYFHPMGKNFHPDFKLIHTMSFSNKHLPNGYLDSLKSMYDELFYKQEVLGEFVILTQKQAYYAFKPEEHIKEFDLFKTPFWAYCDFNVDPMTGGVIQYVNGKIYVCDEKFLRNSDTYQFVDSMKEYWGSNIVPDSTGNGRSSTGTSNFDILQTKFNVIYNHNPHVIDRVNNINRLFKEGKLVIHPRCKNLINDLNLVSWNDNGKLDQVKNKLLTHSSDGLGYVAWYLDPIDTIRRSKITFM